MNKHVSYRYDFETIVAGIFRLIDNPGLLKKYKTFLEPEWFYYNDASEERVALREIIKIIVKESAGKNADLMSIVYLESKLPVLFFDEKTSTRLLGAFRSWRANEKITRLMADDGVFELFLNYLKVLQVAKVTKAFSDKYQSGDIDSAMEIMSGAFNSASGIGQSHVDRLSLHDIDDMLAKEDKYTAEALFPFSTPGSLDKHPLDAIIGGFQKQTLNLFISTTNGGKCFKKGTEILMYNGGIKLVEDVVAGDLVMGDDSAPRTVLGLARGNEMMYKISPKKGNPYFVNKSHILTLLDDKTGKIIDISLEDFLSKRPEELWYKKDPTGRKHHRYLSVSSSGVNFPDNNDNLDIPPYLLGIWLGDGTSAKPEITNIDAEVISRTERELATIGDSFKQTNSCAITYTAYNKQDGCAFRRKLKENNLLSDISNRKNNKHIPQKYKVASRAARLELLAGLIDSDGYKHREGNYEVTSKYKILADDVAFLARSLGFAAFISIGRKCAQSKVYRDYYKVTILGDGSTIPVELPRKRSLPRKSFKKFLHYPITIQECGNDDYFGFSVDGNHRFLLSDFTVVHNSAMSHHLIEACLKRKMKVWVACVEDSKRSFIYKLIANMADVEIRSLRGGMRSLSTADSERVRAAKQLINDYLEVQFVYGKSIDEVHKMALEYDAQCAMSDVAKPMVNIIDYTGHIASKSSGDKMHEKYRNAFGARKDFALANDKICFDFAQVNREGTKNLHADKELTQADLAGAYDLSQVCDNIISINRGASDITNQTCRLHLAKARDGMAGLTVRVGTDFFKATYVMEKFDFPHSLPKGMENEFKQSNN